MSKEILMVVDAVSNEKGVDEEIIFQALESALASATRKRYTSDVDVRVAIDRESGEYDSFRRWEVMEDDEEQDAPTRQISHAAAALDEPDIQIGDFVEEPIESVCAAIRPNSTDSMGSLTYSPGCFNQVASVASVIDSDRTGTLTSISISFSLAYANAASSNSFSCSRCFL